MEVHEAKAFLAVAEELHFGRAAATLRIAQPPLSRLIKSIEKSLGAQLFERSTRQVSLTPAGAALVEPARELVAASEQARTAVAKSMTGETGRVRLGFAGASINRKVGELARHVRTHRPGVHLELHGSQFSHTAMQKVLDGSLDVAIGRWDFIPSELRSSVIGHEEVMVVLPSNHPLAEAPRVEMSQLAEESWVILPAGPGAALQNRLTSLATAAGFVPRVAQVAPDSWTLVVLVAAQIGCALSLDTVRDNVSSDGVVFRPLAQPQRPLDVQLVWRAADSNPALRAVVRLAQNLYGDPRGQAAEVPGS
ncbi:MULTISPECIES: LysR family transcriptional regulator [Kocuria]|uniref:Putative LysR family transcriptional regulator n=1 Tax=Kocuria rhizophila (strain ATCC 9341 / DSM 348 / NBRC 103217 / DC2201) TaxID=378753 RepID=B2GHL6_KOCRD|nr:MULTISPECIES: LysR family transcriptional regulator [Kocuria]ASE11166.1 LysR family transcriptional regulator [Kocuria rhizophila]MCC5672751.1 LysR family transcriptional regulator [Kocuria rhizophila]MCC5674692.1 LysR family transcriptional regulator [Kocuria rhizophila]VEH75852.1 Hca operon transcriptional activator [Kocuria rhizophila]BAG28855.1 putative LysR family transcriptional regulator [Kocuria rhizophila DC2201]